ncbi:multidrug MFS transporter [Sorangium cellulosum]|uniref:Multidrug MFS transporter n=1 Tax=Sorangium cellulosum TaxID=56 RepID=A0A2L0FA89_SORCE|nr:MDR family MFS transporter [Sorangium cellulosum]AUX48431.1 multidrug MFS transporter [Sorangium cellulosum]
MSSSNLATQPSFAPVELTRQEKVFTMAGTLLGLLLAALDQTIVATAGPLIQRDLHIEPSLYVWITTAYLVASTVLVPIYGKLSDLFGRKPVLLTGMSIFLLGSLLCGVSQSAVQLILSRALQGVGSAALFTTAFAVVADIFPPAERGKYQGIFGAAFGLSSVLGPLAGGFITDRFGWHWAFFINLPLGAIAMFFVITRMPMLKQPRSRRVSIDLAGALSLIVAVVPLLLALSLGKGEHAPSASGYPWSSWQILSLFGLAAAGLVAFIAVERQAAEPILDLRLFSGRAFSVGNAASFVVGMAFLAAIVFLPLFMVNVVGLSATHSGLTTTPLTFGIVAGNVASGQLVARTGRYKPLMLGALAMLAVAFVVMGFTLTPESTQGEVTLKMILVGLGLGPTVPLYTLAVQNAVPPARIGVATSATTFFRSMGSTIGIAVIGTVFAGALASGMRENVAAATASVPPALRAQLEGGPGAGAAGAEEGGPTQLAFDAARAQRAVDVYFDQQRSTLTAALRDRDPAAIQALSESPAVDPRLRELARAPEPVPAEALGAALDGVERGRAAALATLDRIGAAMKLAFTDAIKQIYQVCIGLALLALLLTAALPELPLRRDHGAPPAPLE